MFGKCIKMASTLAVLHHKPRCHDPLANNPILFFFTSKPIVGEFKHKVFGWRLRSSANTRNGGMPTYPLKPLTASQTFGWNFEHQGHIKGYGAGEKIRAVHAGGRDDYTGGAHGGGGGGGGGQGGEGEGTGDEDADAHRTDSFLSWYLLLLEKFPVTTKAVTSALLTFFGDLFCQLVIENSSKLDVKRIFMFTLLGLVLVGPTLHFWYLSLSKLVSGTGASRAALRLLLDQLFFSPLFIGVFFSSLLTLEGRPSEILPKLHQEWFASVVANWKLWIPFQFLNFLVVPQQLQVLAANVIALAWNVYLSFASHRKVAQTKSFDS